MAALVIRRFVAAALAASMAVAVSVPAVALAQIPCDQNQPPIIGGFMNPSTIVESHHQYVPVQAITVVGDDDSGPVTISVTVTSSEADSGLGRGDKPNDIVQPDPNDIYHFLVRAELGKGSTSRTYTFTYTATDSCGASSTTSVTVTVLPRR